MRLKGKIAIVTGGGGGIGRATAIRFAKEGAKILLVY
ncbi:SDR family NAD(P)-dependent oxidoreductase [Parageobacillus toebii]